MFTLCKRNHHWRISPFQLSSLSWACFIPAFASAPRDQENGGDGHAVLREDLFDTLWHRQHPFSFRDLSLQKRELLVYFCHSTFWGVLPEVEVFSSWMIVRSSFFGAVARFLALSSHLTVLCCLAFIPWRSFHFILSWVCWPQDQHQDFQNRPPPLQYICQLSFFSIRRVFLRL